MAKIPDKNLGAEDFFSGLYSPEYVPDQLDLSNFLSSPVDSVQAAAKSAEAKVQGAESGEITGPLTIAEAEAIDAKIDELIEGVDATTARIHNIRAVIGQQVSPEGGEELSFKMDISKKHSLKRAIAVVFGVKSDTITYSQYQQCLELKRQIEADESSDYVAGNWGE
jgi:hypothetical protein